MAVLLIAEHEKGVLKPATYAAVTAAKQLNTELVLLIVGHDLTQVGQQASKINGVDKVLLADDLALQHQLAEDVAAVVLTQAKQFSHIMFAASARGKSSAPRVAAKLDVAQISEVSALLSADEFVRAIYTGSVLAQVKSLDPIKVLTLRTSAFAAAEQQNNSAPIEVIASVTANRKPRFVESVTSNLERAELTSAEVVVAGGRGFSDQAQFMGLLLPLADKLGAAIGASRAAVDAEFAPNDWQIGQTGKVVAPKLYIAVGISGAIQHLSGMTDAKVIVAINHDAEAPIFRVADYGLVADLNQALPELLRLLES